MTNKEKYREYCKQNQSVPIFSKDWWLDAVCGADNWDVALVENEGLVSASLPYFKKPKWGFKLLIMPKLTQTLGPHITYPKGQKYASQIAHDKKIMTELIEQLPRFDCFYQNFHYSITNWLPFHWEGFSQTTRYTYVLNEIQNHNKLFESFRSNIRREIKKAEKQVTVTLSDDVQKAYALAQMTYERQKIKISFSYEYLKNLDRACQEKNCRKIFFAQDDQGHIHAVIYIVWDNNSAYYLFGGGDPKYRNSGATSLLMWEAIKFASSVSPKFDFEGSMQEPIERFFRAFGAVQKPYFQVIKVNSYLLKFAKFFTETFATNRKIRI